MDIKSGKIKAVVFDLDGTLLDTLQDLAAAANWALKANGMPERTQEEVRQFVGNGVRRLMEQAVPAGTDERRFEQVFADFKQYYVLHCQEKTCLYDGIPALLQTLKDAGYRLAIVSNKLQEGVDELYDRYFRDTVEVAIGERQGLRRKPAPDMVQLALRELGVSAAEAVYVGDSDVDLQTATNSGLPCISVLWGFRDKEFLLAHGATCFAERPTDVVQKLIQKTERNIILITGGQRSGKSLYAEQLALSLAEHPIYMATAHVWDDEFRERVHRHQERRGSEWTNIEEERWLSRHDVGRRVVLVDCLTLWATNFFYADGAEKTVDEALDQLKMEFDHFIEQQATFIIVTNEIGWGGTPVNDVQRRFTDLLGWLNQYVASKADEVVMMVSGIPVKVKTSQTAPSHP